MRVSIRTRVILSIILGNGLEFYDLMLFGIFAPVLSSLFFYSHDKYLSLNVTYLAFAISFIFRPLGALYFGHIADKLGRKKALSRSILLMAFATGMIGLTPTYNQAGIIAPILITLFRCIQGFSAGGEYNSSAVFLLEYTPKARNLNVSFLTASGVVGSLMATVFFNINLNPLMPSWFWRVPFCFGAIIGILGLYIRLKLQESPEFIKASDSNQILINPLFKILKADRKELTISFIIGAFNGIIYYFQFIYLTSYFNTSLGITLKDTNFLNTFGLSFYMFFLIMNGFLADFIGTKKVMTFACLGFILLTLPLFYMISSGKIFFLIISEIIFSYMNASFCGLKHVFLAELFPTNRRCIGVSFGYSLGLAFFGGTTPFIMALLNKKFGDFIEAYYVIFFGILSFLAITYTKFFKNPKEH